jgi:hypothetical protein
VCTACEEVEEDLGLAAVEVANGDVDRPAPGARAFCPALTT